MTAALKFCKGTGLFSTLMFISFAGFCSPAFAKQITPDIILDTSVRMQVADVNNSDLNTSGSNNVGAGALEARFKLTDNFNKDALLFLDASAVGSLGRGGFQSADTGAISNGNNFLLLRQAYLQFGNKDEQPASLRVGRQKVAEPYGVWWNQNFDAVRISYNTTLFNGMLAGGQNFSSYQTGNRPLAKNDRDLLRVLAEGSWQYYYQHFFEARLMYQDDHSGIAVGNPENANNPDDRQGHLVWGGVRAAGKTPFVEGADKMSYRVDLMAVSGREDVATIAGGVITALNNKHVRGWAFDAGTDIPLPHAKPVVHLGYAFGSGDSNAADGTDHAFRQSGLAGNFSRIGALSENTNNYGTVLRPELANIHILSAGVTMPVLTASDVGVIYRYYRLDDLSASLASSGVYNTLDGVHRQLGQGVDFLFNMDLVKEKQVNDTHVQDVALRSSFGFFRSGNAYGTASGETAVRGLVEMKVGF